MATIIIPTPLRKFTANQSTFKAEGNTVREALQQLTHEHTGLSTHLLDAEQNLRSFIRVYVGDEDINELNGAETSVSDQTIISIVPAIAGGIQ